MNPQAVTRLMQDYVQLLNEKNPLIHVYMHEDNISIVDVLIIGPQGTPYRNGFFHFRAEYPVNYPWSPPAVLIRNTNQGTVRFGPNLYSNGRVCLSILGTWPGPGWLPSQTMSSTFVSIQSLLSEYPYLNEPSFENYDPSTQIICEYTNYICYETIRTAVCHTLDNPTWSKKSGLGEIAEIYFLENYSQYIELATQNSKIFDRHPLPSSSEQGYNQYYDYKSLINRLKNIRKRLIKKHKHYFDESIDNDSTHRINSYRIEKIKKRNNIDLVTEDICTLCKYYGATKICKKCNVLICGSCAQNIGKLCPYCFNSRSITNRNSIYYKKWINVAILILIFFAVMYYCS
jgi:ubiquitin-conjugating enzyme E2 Z